MEFKGVRILDFGLFEVIVINEGCRYVLRFNGDGTRLHTSYGPGIERFGRECFAKWCADRKMSHAGTDMA